ncbi:MAG: hypothetical protein OQL11_11145 [Gammaproteobacteria bacterium]|nr:hypothetical protein [Gammaproteobacteria bacterium]
MARLTNKQKGEANEAKLEAYIRSTPLSKIPTNQYGSASQKRILTDLGIPTSNRDSESISTLFEKLNKKLGAETVTRSTASSEEVRSLKRTISTLQDRIASLKAENELLRSQQQQELWFLETGRVIRP